MINKPPTSDLQFPPSTLTHQLARILFRQNSSHQPSSCPEPKASQMQISLKDKSEHEPEPTSSHPPPPLATSPLPPSPTHTYTIPHARQRFHLPHKSLSVAPNSPPSLLQKPVLGRDTIRYDAIDRHSLLAPRAPAFRAPGALPAPFHFLSIGRTAGTASNVTICNDTIVVDKARASATAMSNRIARPTCPSRPESLSTYTNAASDPEATLFFSASAITAEHKCFRTMQSIHRQRRPAPHPRHLPPIINTATSRRFRVDGWMGSGG